MSKWISKETNLCLLSFSGLWTIALLASLTWNITGNQHTAIDIAKVQARKSFEKDLLVRRWNASHGGVYAPVSERTPPNPHLTTAERDITTPSGRKLTLINPAYMTRQLHEMALDYNGDAGHITSLKPIRPENSPDEWETEALKSFNDGNPEAYTILKRDGKDYLRLMRPLLTEKSCLKCHFQQGYAEGMIRGGISVIVPVPPLNKMYWHSNIALFVAHFLLWIIGLLMHTFMVKKINTAIGQRQQAENDLAEANRDLEIRIAKRTAEYEKVYKQLENSSRQWRHTFDVMSDFVSVHDKDMKIQKVNKALANFLGKEPQELIGKYCYEIIHKTQKPLARCPHLQAIETREIVSEEMVDPGSGKILLVTCSPFFNDDGDLIGTVHVARDITNENLAKQEREKLINDLQISLEEVKMLRGILPICSFCKNIRNDDGYYEQIENYIHKHSGVDFSHTICPTCAKKHYPEIFKAKKEDK